MPPLAAAKRPRWKKLRRITGWAALVICTLIVSVGWAACVFTTRALVWGSYAVPVGPAPAPRYVGDTSRAIGNRWSAVAVNGFVCVTLDGNPAGSGVADPGMCWAVYNHWRTPPQGASFSQDQFWDLEEMTNRDIARRYAISAGWLFKVASYGNQQIITVRGWSVLGVLSGLLAIGWFLAVRAAIARRRAQCVCGYNHQGLPAQTPCPECGKPWQA